MMKKGLKMRSLLLLCLLSLCCVGLLCGCQAEDAAVSDAPVTDTTQPSAENQSATTYSGEILVSAAASLREPLTQAAALYQQTQPDLTVNFNFGGSGALLQQLENGAPSDIFISAATKQMNDAETANLIVSDSRFDWLLNKLVMAVPAASTLEINSMDDVTQAATIAIGAPESVPAGAYAQEAMTNAGIWEQVQEALVLGKDVSQVTAFVESGSADLGFIYLSDLTGRDQVKVAMEVPADLYAPVTYPAALLQSSVQPDAAQDFLDFLKTPAVTEIMEQYGFTVIEN